MEGEGSLSVVPLEGFDETDDILMSKCFEHLHFALDVSSHCLIILCLLELLDSDWEGYGRERSKLVTNSAKM